MGSRIVDECWTVERFYPDPDSAFVGFLVRRESLQSLVNPMDAFSTRLRPGFSGSQNAKKEFKVGLDSLLDLLFRVFGVDGYS